MTDYAFGEVTEEGALKFEARPSEGDGAWRRMIFTPVAPDTVTQEIFLSTGARPLCAPKREQRTRGEDPGTATRVARLSWR